MTRKRIRSQEEIIALAKRLRARWNPGEPLRPWLRGHAGMLLKLIHGGWSWANLAAALEEAGIKYDTEKKWTADWLQSDFHRARAPLKGYARRRVPASSEAAQAAPPMAASPTSVDPPQAFAAFREEFAEPEFKFARFIDWDEERKSETRTRENGVIPATPANSQRYDEVMAQLTGKKPPY
jgi:hypothetical protein